MKGEHHEGRAGDGRKLLHVKDLETLQDLWSCTQQGRGQDQRGEGGMEAIGSAQPDGDSPDKVRKRSGILPGHQVRRYVEYKEPWGA